MAGINFKDEREYTKKLVVKEDADIPTIIGYTWYKSSTNNNYFIRETRRGTIIASFVYKEHLVKFLKTL